MKTITIELKADGGFELKGLEDIESRSECIWLMLAVRMLETRALEIGYLPELMEGFEEWVDKSKDKVRFLTKEEQEGLGFDNPVPPTYISIELPNNVPSKVRPIVILPTIEAKKVIVTVTEYDSSGAKMFNTTIEPNKSHVINLNTGVE
ncbi:hypothetical protein [Granulicatella adiacens]|uniref:hypothetical protein n=1 Tax=Granulicatella adiacens TaxID=46124 RepID=UPI0021A885C3|nr:hypothetical protein [Granulicatella adiacens]MCT2160030.1 hypothetical protein [Granulicatella adiacens]